MIYGGLRFLPSGDGEMHVTIYDGLAENSPVAREVIFPKEVVDAVISTVRPPKVKKARRKVKKTKK